MGRLEVQNLSVWYGARSAVQSVTLQAARGIVALIGPNGSGKSSLLRGVVGLTPGRSGEIRLDGRPVAKDPIAANRAGIGILLQGGRVFPTLTVEENVARLARDRPGALDRALDLFPDLRAHRRRPAGVLSGGLRQQVALAAVLHGGYSMLLLDEPTGSLSTAAAERLLGFLDEWTRAGDRSVLVAEQNVAPFLSRLTSAYLLVGGQLVESFTGANLERSEFRNALLGKGAKP